MDGHMKKYDCLIEDIRYELEAARHYAKEYCKYKGEDRVIANLYHELAEQEFKHATMLREHVPKVVMLHDALPIIWERDNEHITWWMAKVKHTLEMMKD